MLQGKQQAVYGDAAQCTSSPGQPDGWTQIKHKKRKTEDEKSLFRQKLYSAS